MNSLKSWTSRCYRRRTEVRRGFGSRDKASLDIFWLRDESLSDSDNLPAPEVIAAEIVEDLEAALEQFRVILADMDSTSIEIQGTGAPPV